MSTLAAWLAHPDALRPELLALYYWAIVTPIHALKAFVAWWRGPEIIRNHDVAEQGLLRR
jgi:hypothetical protein